MLSGVTFSTSLFEQTLAGTDDISSNQNQKKPLDLNSIRELEVKVEQAISTLTEVLTELHNRRDTTYNLTSAWYHPNCNTYAPDSNHISTSTGHNLHNTCQNIIEPSMVFSHGINSEGVAVVKLVTSEDLRSVNKCTTCDKVFEDRLKLRNHLRIHKQTRKYKCEICALGFPVPSKLKEHMRTHTGERPYQCDICMRCFTKSSSLKRHRQLHRSQLVSIPSQLGVVIQDQVVENMDRPISPAFKEVQIENESVRIPPYHQTDTFLTHIESDISSASGSP